MRQTAAPSPSFHAPALVIEACLCAGTGRLSDGLGRGIAVVGGGWFALMLNRIGLHSCYEKSALERSAAFFSSSTGQRSPACASVKGYVCLKLIKPICIK